MYVFFTIKGDWSIYCRGLQYRGSNGIQKICNDYIKASFVTPMDCKQRLHRSPIKNK